MTFTYEPTPYPVLLRLANSGYIGKKNTFLDYGCGKGRVDLFFAYQIGCRCIGVEYDERIYSSACKNKMTAVSGGKVEIINTKAEDYPVPSEVDRIFFFNPFSVEIFKRVISRLWESWDGRELLLFFYYISEDYFTWLSDVPVSRLIDEIDCRDLSEGNNRRECIMVYQFGY